MSNYSDLDDARKGLEILPIGVFFPLAKEVSQEMGRHRRMKFSKRLTRRRSLILSWRLTKGRFED